MFWRRRVGQRLLLIIPQVSRSILSQWLRTTLVNSSSKGPVVCPKRSLVFHECRFEQVRSGRTHFVDQLDIVETIRVRNHSLFSILANNRSPIVGNLFQSSVFPLDWNEGSWQDPVPHGKMGGYCYPTQCLISLLCWLLLEEKLQTWLPYPGCCEAWNEDRWSLLQIKMVHCHLSYKETVWIQDTPPDRGFQFVLL